mgnify:FL=1
MHHYDAQGMLASAADQAGASDCCFPLVVPCAPLGSLRVQLPGQAQGEHAVRLEIDSGAEPAADP